MFRFILKTRVKSNWMIWCSIAWSTWFLMFSRLKTLRMFLLLWVLYSLHSLIFFIYYIQIFQKVHGFYSDFEESRKQHLPEIPEKWKGDKGSMPAKIRSLLGGSKPWKNLVKLLREEVMPFYDEYKNFLWDVDIIALPTGEKISFPNPAHHPSITGQPVATSSYSHAYIASLSICPFLLSICFLFLLIPSLILKNNLRISI